MLRGRLTYSNVMSTIAVLGILAGGTAFAANRITARQIAKGAVKTSKIRNGAVTTAKLANRAVKAGKLGTVVTRFGTEPLPDDGTLHSSAAQCAAAERS